MARAPTVLNVNDWSGARARIGALLASAGWTVLDAETGSQALDRAREVDAIVLDADLPDLDGHEVCRRLKAIRETSCIPIVLTSTTAAGSEDRVEGLESGADAFLVEPFEGLELVATIRALLRMHAAEREAKQALLSRDDFLAVASHELKTPLTSMTLQIDALEALWEDERWSEVPKATIGKKLDILKRQSRQLLQVIDNLLDASCLRAGRFSLATEELDLSALVREVTDRLAPDVERSGCDVRIDAPEKVSGRWDRHRLEQVVSHLVGNALRYGERGEVKLCVSQESPHVAKLTVEDCGLGIAEDDQARIFERFERASINPNRPGLGLGLWIIREIVVASGGTIGVASELGRGSTFTVRLPLA